MDKLSCLIFGSRDGCTANAEHCQKPFNLEGVEFNVDSRCKVILDLLKVSFYSKI